MTGTLYLIPNTLQPPGACQPEAAQSDTLAHVIPENVQTITARLDYFIAENAKSARSYLKMISVTHPLVKPLQEIHISELNVKTDVTALPALLTPLLAGQDAGLISEAGVPAVADTGANLVRLAHRHGIPVKPLVGPSSLLLAIMASGLNGQSFAFHGYLPTDASQRAKRLKALEERSRLEKQTQLFIETPYRNAALLEAMATTCKPNTLVCIATDLSLASESIKTQTAGSWLADLKAGRVPSFQKKPTVFLLLAD